MPDEADPVDELQAVLDALDDPDCRRILRQLDTPMTAQEIVHECGISQTTTYRKLDLLSEASLVEEGTEMREDGHHATIYTRSIGGVYIDVENDGFTVELERRAAESAEERLARYWSEVSDEF